MVNKQRDLLKIRIELNDILPPIWREILIPARYSFRDLHVAIQDAMGWWDSLFTSSVSTAPEGNSSGR